MQATRHHKNERKQYTYEEVIQKYKDDYEKTVANLKASHDESMQDPNIKIADLTTKIEEDENKLEELIGFDLVKPIEDIRQLHEYLEKFYEREVRSMSPDDREALRKKLKENKNLSNSDKEIKNNITALEIVRELKRFDTEEKKEETLQKTNATIKLRNIIVDRFNNHFCDELAEDIRHKNKKRRKKNLYIEEINTHLYDVIAKNKEKIEELSKINTNAEYSIIALMEAEKVWLAVKIVAANENFSHMNDEEKIDLIRKDFAEFYNNFPIVSRYMICMGQYKQKAFRKFLKQCEQKLSQTPTKKEENYMQNQWIECQASYVRFLWEELQTKKFSRQESNEIWQQTHRALTAEFKQFKEQHMKTEEKIKLDDKNNKVELLSEVVHRVSTGTQKLDLDKTRALVNKLRDRKYKQDYETVLRHLENSVKFIEPKLSGRGINEEAQYEYESDLQQQEYKKKYKKMDLTPKVF